MSAGCAARSGALDAAPPPVELMRREGPAEDTLYFVKGGGGHTTSDSLAAILQRFPEARAAGVDLDRLAALALALPESGDSRTAWRRIGRVPPAHRLVVRDGALALERLALPPLPTLPDGLARRAEALRAALVGAVARAVAGHERVAVFVSGGLDSSAVLALVARELGRDSARSIVPIAIDFASPGDDRAFLADLAGRLGLEIVRIAPEDTAHALVGALVADASPFGWPSAAWEHVAMRRAKELGCTVFLTGAGGDDVLDGAPIDFGAPATAREFVRALASAPVRGERQSFVVRKLAASWMDRSLPWLRARWHARRSRRAVPTWAGSRLVAHAARAYPERAPSGAAERLAAMLGSAHLAEVAEMRTQLAQSTGLERRDPFLDLEVIGLAGALSPAELAADGIHRGLLRRAMRAIVPARVWQRRDKAAFEAAFRRTWRAAGDIECVAAHADAREMTRLGLADGRAFRGALDMLARLPDHDGDWLGVWPGLAVEAFLSSSQAPEGEAKR